MLTPRITAAEVTNIRGMLSIRWTTSPEAHPVSIESYLAPSANQSPSRTVARNLSHGQLVLDTATSRQRRYFVLSPEGGSPVTVAERILPLEGARNFRDLGGYQTRTGQRVKWGVLFRSDYLAHLSDADCEYLRTLEIRTIFDLRANMERERHPSRWHAQSITNTVCWEDTQEGGKLGQRLQSYRRLNSQEDEDDLSGFLSQHYRGYLEMQAFKYQGILTGLVNKEAAPALIHCTAGKDRTGIIAALILHLLGVDEDTIMQDYLLTNRHLESADEEERFKLLLQQFGVDEISGPALNAIRLAHAEYLHAAFDGMREIYGSVEQYAEKRLGFDTAMTDRLRLLYLD